MNKTDIVNMLSAQLGYPVSDHRSDYPATAAYYRVLRRSAGGAPHTPEELETEATWLDLNQPIWLIDEIDGLYAECQGDEEKFEKLLADVLNTATPPTRTDNERPFDAYPTHMVFTELVNRAEFSNGLETIPMQDRLKLAAMLLNSTRG